MLSTPSLSFPQIQSSMPADLFRKVAIQVLVKEVDSKIVIHHIIDTCCLLPDTEETVDADGKPCTEINDHKACRGGNSCHRSSCSRAVVQHHWLHRHEVPLDSTIEAESIHGVRASTRHALQPS